jgi:hypothetical protein
MKPSLGVKRETKIALSRRELCTLTCSDSPENQRLWSCGVGQSHAAQTVVNEGHAILSKS